MLACGIGQCSTHLVDDWFGASDSSKTLANQEGNLGENVDFLNQAVFPSGETSRDGS